MIYMAIGISIFLFSLCLILFWVQGNINKELSKDLDHLYDVLRNLKKVGTEIHNETIRALVELESKIADKVYLNRQVQAILHCENELNKMTNLLSREMVRIQELQKNQSSHHLQLQTLKKRLQDQGIL